MPEAVAAGQRELLGVLVEPGFELRCRWLVRSSDVFGEELHLLRHAALHDGVVFVESHRQSFAIQDFFVHLIFDHCLEFLRRRLAVPLRLEVEVHLAKVVEGDKNLAGGLDAHAATMHVGVDGEERETDQEEMQKGLAQQAFKCGWE